MADSDVVNPKAPEQTGGASAAAVQEAAPSAAPHAPNTDAVPNLNFYVPNPDVVADQPPPKKMPVVLPLVGVLLVGLIAVTIAVVFFSKKKDNPALPFQDLGAGISNSTGLKGNLQVRWNTSGQYQLKIEPIDPLQSAGFSFVTADPPWPLSINFRLLDATGFALCSKEVLFHFNPANAAALGGADAAGTAKSASGAPPQQPEMQKSESDREKGKDIFQSTTGDDGKIIAVNSQGALPCTEDQYRAASYWDFSTNFPTLAEQETLLNASENKARLAAARAAMLRKNAGRMAASFTAEGYDAVSGFDPVRGVIEARLGRNFLVTRAADRATATAWANASALFHYKCDQRSRCALTHSGGGETIFVTALQ